MTSFEESFGLVVIEAQSYKIPVVTFDSATGVVEILNNTGIVVVNRNKDEMVKETIKLINDKEFYKKSSAQSFGNSLKYSFENIKKEWLKFLKNI